jgi:SAM-dependent methyltransferase
MTQIIAPHLGGHGNATSMQLPVFDFIQEKFKIKSVIDIGCGPAGMVEYSNYKGIYSIGIDGDTSLDSKEYVINHDYTLGALELNQNFDLAYSVEFLEHVEERYVSNFMPSFQKANYVFCTAATPGQGGHHHVNLRFADYWISKFQEYGFEYDEETLIQIRSKTNETIIQKNALFFKNKEFVPVSYDKLPFQIEYDKLKEIVNNHHDGHGQNFVLYDKWI